MGGCGNAFLSLFCIHCRLKSEMSNCWNQAKDVPQVQIAFLSPSTFACSVYTSRSLFDDAWDSIDLYSHLQSFNHSNLLFFYSWFFFSSSSFLFQWNYLLTFCIFFFCNSFFFLLEDFKNRLLSDLVWFFCTWSVWRYLTPISYLRLYAHTQISTPTFTYLSSHLNI